jgi:hypothetical protein
MPAKAMLLLGCLTFGWEALASPPTRLYVRTVPPGAKVTLDGKSLGKSDALFPVMPGTQTVQVELAGYLPEERRVEIRAEEITRVELELKRRPEAAGRAGSPSLPSAGEVDAGKKDDAASIAANAYLTDADLPAPVRDAMLTVLRQHPGESRWSGRAGTIMFGIAAKRLPARAIRQRAVPAMLDLTHMLAFQELLKAKSLLDRYAATGLTDATTLERAVVEAAGKLNVKGRASTVLQGGTVKADYAIAYVMAEEQRLLAQLLQETELGKVRGAYRDVMHRQARELMQRSNWTDALLFWQHLHTRKLVSQQLYLDAASCFQHLNQVPDMIRVLTEAIDTFGKNATPEFLEKAGDMALAIDTAQAQTLAEKAYRLASEQLKETISSGHEHTATADQGQ